MTTTNLTDLSDAQLNNLVLSLGEPEYRVKQLRNWIYRKLAFSYREMTDLPLAFREEMEKRSRLHSLEMVDLMTGRDGTIKALFTLADGRTIEAALLVHHQENGKPRFTVCISTQVGCSIGCPFCATGQQGFERNLTCGEIIDQVLYFARYLKNQFEIHCQTTLKDPTLINIVFMGMGEPLANYRALWPAIEKLNSPDGFKLGARNMTISTAGLVPLIRCLGYEKIQVGLAVSLHTADNTLRDSLVPLNRRYPLEELISACKEYYRLTGRRVSFEYVLFRGINDSVNSARALAKLLQSMNCHVNLIPANQTANGIFHPSSTKAILAFERELHRSHVNTTLRQPRGQDICAGCGQLRSRFLHDSGNLKKKLVKA